MIRKIGHSDCRFELKMAKYSTRSGYHDIVKHRGCAGQEWGTLTSLWYNMEPTINC